MMNELENTSFVGGFKTVKTSEKDARTVIYRVAINNKEESVTWLKDYSRITLTEWIVSNTYPNTVKCEYRKAYKCAFSSKNKILPKGRSNRNYNCKATLNIKIKLLTKSSRYKDKYLQEEPPLRGIIEILEEHCHSDDSSSVLPFLRPGKDLRETFEEYFLTMKPAAALAHHKALIKSLKNGSDLLGNGQYMPRKTSVYFWHREWRTSKFEPLLNPLTTLEENIDFLLEKENQCTEESRASSHAECAVSDETLADLIDGEALLDSRDDAETLRKKALEDMKLHLCRICGLRSEELSSILHEEGSEEDNISLQKKIEMYLPIELNADDGLPLNICPKCSDLVEAWHELYLSCVAADSVLRQVFDISEERGGELHQISNNNNVFQVVFEGPEDQSEEKSSQEQNGEQPSRAYEQRLVESAAESREQGDSYLGENSTMTIGNCNDFVQIRDLIGSSYLLTCHHCSQRFLSVLECSQHKKQCGREPSICEICGKSVRERRNLKFHREQHFFVPVLCEKCGYQLESKSSELHHEEKCPGRGKKRKYFCEPCCKVFSAERSFKVHEEQHKKAKKNSNLGNFSLESCTVNNGEVCFICPVCCGRFEDELSLIEHMNTNVKSHCLECGKSLQNEREVVLHYCRKWTCP